MAYDVAASTDNTPFEIAPGRKVMKKKKMKKILCWISLFLKYRGFFTDLDPTGFSHPTNPLSLEIFTAGP